MTNTMRNIRRDPMQYVTYEFAQYVRDLKAIGYDEEIYPRTLTVDGVEVPCWCFIQGHNASHQFVLAESQDGKRWFKVSNGETSVLKAELDAEEMAIFNWNWKRVQDGEVDKYATDLIFDGSPEPIGLVTGRTRVTEVSDFSTAASGYHGHW